MENDIPKIDLPDDWIIGNLSHKDIGLLSLYANYPCRLKAEIFVLCMQGEIEASINLTRYQVKPGSFITILPGTILQIHKGGRRFADLFYGFFVRVHQPCQYRQIGNGHAVCRKRQPDYRTERTAGPIAERLFFATCQNV